MKRQKGSSLKLEILLMTGGTRVWRFQEVQRVREWSQRRSRVCLACK